MITVRNPALKHYPHVSLARHITYNFPNLCTFTVDGEFGFVFCNIDTEDDDTYEGVIEYIEETSPGKVEYIAFWG